MKRSIGSDECAQRAAALCDEFKRLAIAHTDSLSDESVGQVVNQRLLRPALLVNAAWCSGSFSA